MKLYDIIHKHNNQGMDYKETCCHFKQRILYIYRQMDRLKKDIEEGVMSYETKKFLHTTWKEYEDELLYISHRKDLLEIGNKLMKDGKVKELFEYLKFNPDLSQPTLPECPYKEERDEEMEEFLRNDAPF